ncbi:uncharacterized protein GGS25DRAFT_523346 [Hypoxylon fragiforme]|uniref:uncharacterized protein n=1 Tax=Hypoxylon fragiforme TaxID=63214 RepID=UPI0020C5F6B4|nr:uncharacterized protein GGS25DRAFT_523346 [Hypoxylon fragiforme]KAI2605674.1 hypothetical protein GGS25DRAFT_523346 [Hypoxylon fragiforme]
MDPTVNNPNNNNAGGSRENGRYNLRKRPLQKPTFLRFLNEHNFPFLTNKIKEIDDLHQDFNLETFDSEETTYSPPATLSEPRSPNSRDVSPISPPNDLEVEYFGFEVVTPRVSPSIGSSSPGRDTPDSKEEPLQGNPSQTRLTTNLEETLQGSSSQTQAATRPPLHIRSPSRRPAVKSAKQIRRKPRTKAPTESSPRHDDFRKDHRNLPR